MTPHDLDILSRIAPLDLGWLAGVIEGEGSISLRSGARNSRWVVVRVAMTDRDVIERLRAVTGFGKITTVSPRNPAHLDQYQWAVGSRAECQALLTAIRPQMGVRRSAKIADALTYLAAYPTPSRRGEKNVSSKLTSDIVRQIRTDHADGVTPKTLAATYGIAFQTAYKIVQRKTWMHI